MRGPILITGLMRSGTSVVSSIVHRLGYQVSLEIPAPAPPKWRSDWEDLYLSMDLMKRKRINWKSYLDDRREISDMLGFLGVAIKSPYLALRYGEISSALEDCTWIVTQRERSYVDRSFAKCPQLSEDDQEKISGSVTHIYPAIVVAYEDLLMDPYAAVASLSKSIDGYSDEESLSAAAGLVIQKKDQESWQS